MQPHWSGGNSHQDFDFSTEFTKWICGTPSSYKICTCKIHMRHCWSPFHLAASSVSHVNNSLFPHKVFMRPLCRLNHVGCHVEIKCSRNNFTPIFGCFGNRFPGIFVSSLKCLPWVSLATACHLLTQNKSDCPELATGLQTVGLVAWIPLGQALTAHLVTGALVPRFLFPLSRRSAPL